jgi:hypothetical protein
MVLSELEIKRCEKALDAFLKKRRPKSHMRNQLDFGYEIDDQDVILSEIRPNLRNPMKSIINHLLKLVTSNQSSTGRFTG